MKRREFVALLGGAAASGVSWPLAARAQQAKRPIIGFLGTPAPVIWKDRKAAFLKRLAELGWVDGQTLTIEYRWAEGRPARFRALAEDLVQRNVDVILTSGAAVGVVKQVTSTIPIVFAIGSDPLGAGHVASLARPGGNVTGLSLQGPDAVGKRIDLLRQIIAAPRGFAIITNAGNRASMDEMNNVAATAQKLGIQVTRLEIRRPDDIEPAFATLTGAESVLYICGFDPLVNTNRRRIHKAAAAARLPTISGDLAYVKAGGLMSYGPNFPDMFRRSAEYVDKILRGSKPADLPVQQPTKFNLALNLQTAKSLGLTVPQTLLALADEVIE